jgi:Antirestriction protein (ArdA)
MLTRNIDNYENLIDVRDVIQRVEDLRETSNGSVVDGSLGAEYEGHEDDHEEYAMLAALLDDLRGNGGDEQWEGDWYPSQLVRDSYFTEYARDLAEDIGAVNESAEWPNNCIDWERAGSELLMDYTSVEFDGVTYWFR